MKNPFKCSLLLLGVSLFACKKTNTSPNSTTYQPVSKGTYWKYNNVGRLNFGTSIRTMTGETETFNSKTYNRFIESFNYGPEHSAYYAQQNGDYFIYEKMLGGYEMLFLKENAAIGEIWVHNAAESGGYRHRVKGKLIEKNITHFVADKRYNDVIHTQLTTQQSAPGEDIYTDIQTIDYYVAKGIGIIEVGESTFAAGVKLLEYSIK